jgi:hypothetical protein
LIFRGGRAKENASLKEHFVREIKNLTGQAGFSGFSPQTQSGQRAEVRGRKTEEK